MLSVKHNKEKAALFGRFRAGDGIRTRVCQLGRLMPYHLATPACFAILPPAIKPVKQMTRRVLPGLPLL